MNQESLLQKIRETNAEDFLETIIEVLEKSREGSEFYRRAELFLSCVLAEYERSKRGEQDSKKHAGDVVLRDDIY